MLESARGGMKDGWMDDRLVGAWKMVGLSTTVDTIIHVFYEDADLRRSNVPVWHG
jgi:hypothetical protein